MKGELLESMNVNKNKSGGEAIRRQACFTLPHASNWELLVSIDLAYYVLMSTNWVRGLVLECLKGGYGLKDAP